MIDDKKDGSYYEGCSLDQINPEDCLEEDKEEEEDNGSISDEDAYIKKHCWIEY